MGGGEKRADGAADGTRDGARIEGAAEADAEIVGTAVAPATDGPGETLGGIVAVFAWPQPIATTAASMAGATRVRRDTQFSAGDDRGRRF